MSKYESFYKTRLVLLILPFMLLLLGPKAWTVLPLLLSCWACLQYRPDFLLTRVQYISGPLLTTTLSTLATCLLTTQFFWCSSSGPPDKLFTKIEYEFSRLPIYIVNERVFLCLLASCYTAAVFLWKCSQRPALKFPVIQQSLPKRLFHELVVEVGSAIKSFLRVSWWFYVGYFVVGKLLFSWFVNGVNALILFGDTYSVEASISRGVSVLWNPLIMLDSLFCSMYVLLILQTFIVSLDVATTNLHLTILTSNSWINSRRTISFINLLPTSVSQLIYAYLMRDTHDVLLAMSHDNLYIKHLAFAELLQIASFDLYRRREIYSRPEFWQRILETCSHVLQRAVDDRKREHQLEMENRPKTSQGASLKKEDLFGKNIVPTIAHDTPDIFLTQNQRLQKRQTASSMSQYPQQNRNGHQQPIFKSSQPVADTMPAARFEKLWSSMQTSVVDSPKSRNYAQMFKQWTRKPAPPMVLLPSLAVDILATLLVHAADEDAEGYVRRDVPVVVEILLNVYTSLEEIRLQQQAELRMSTMKQKLADMTPSRTRDKKMMTKLKRCTYSVVHTYQDYLEKLGAMNARIREIIEAN